VAERLRSEVLGNVQGTLVIVEGAEHLLPVEAPEAVTGFIGGLVSEVTAVK